MKNNSLPLKKSLIRLSALFLLVILGSTVSQAQISTKSLVLADTAFMGSGDSAFVTIQNVDNQPYAGYVIISFSTDTIAFTPFMTCSIPSVNLTPNDTASGICAISYDSTYFNPGGNIVVVWSSGNGKFAADTIWDSVYIVSQTAGVHENNQNASFTIFPSPVKDFITIRTNNTSLTKDMVQQIKITDVFGRTIHTQPFSSGDSQKINVRELPQGLYFLELMYGDAKRAVQKFVRAD